MRLFIAVQLSEPVRGAISKVQDDLLRLGVRGKYTPRENQHLTLVFIGEYNDPEQVLDVMSGVPFEPFELRLDGMGCFGDLWWAGLETSAALQGYVRQLRHALAEACIPFDRKRFSPHITVLRRASMQMSRLPGISVEGIGMVADHASLMRSDRGKRGMIYTEIH
jgi:2'-5' RNA ligase